MFRNRFVSYFSLVCLAIWLAACTTTPPEKEAPEPERALTQERQPVSFADLPGWENDNMVALWRLSESPAAYWTESLNGVMSATSLSMWMGKILLRSGHFLNRISRLTGLPAKTAKTRGWRQGIMSRF